jgi:1-acyl-sn-glycerol-3-phosphate acyltransferase
MDKIYWAIAKELLVKKFWDHFLENPEELIYKAAPRFIMEIMRKYFRLQVEGLENLPRKGRAIIAPNHSGYSGFDAMVLAHEVFKATQSAPRVLAHQFWFLTQTTAVPAKKLGFVEATMENGLYHLEKDRSIILFPEGEQGNFKPSSNAYQLEEFKRGFVRMALRAQAPIVPTMIIGAEETHINLKKLKFTSLIRGVVLPLPLNVIPLPARWTIKFLPPVHLPYKPSAAEDRSLVKEIADDIREQIQTSLMKEIGARKSVYL